MEAPEGSGTAPPAPRETAASSAAAPGPTRSGPSPPSSRAAEESHPAASRPCARIAVSPPLTPPELTFSSSWPNLYDLASTAAGPALIQSSPPAHTGHRPERFRGMIQGWQIKPTMADPLDQPRLRPFSCDPPCDGGSIGNSPPSRPEAQHQPQCGHRIYNRLSF